MVELYLHSAICLHGIVLNYVSARKKFTFLYVERKQFFFQPQSTIKILYAECPLPGPINPLSLFSLFPEDKRMVFICYKCC
jgi:hypothetical protein